MAINNQEHLNRPNNPEDAEKLEENELLTENKEEVKSLRNDVEGSQQRLQEVETASEVTKGLDTVPTPTVQKGINKILNKCLDAHPGLQEKFSGKNIKEYKQEMLDKHPELWGIMTLDMGMNSFSSENYDQLQPNEKIKVLAIDGAIHDVLPLVFNLQNEDGSFDTEKLKSRYRQKVEQRMQNILSTFRWDQRFNNLTLGDVDDLLKEEYGFSEKEAKEFKEYITKVQEEYDSMVTMEKSSWRFGLGVLTGVLISVSGYIVYDNIVNPDGVEVIERDRVKLGTPDEVAKLLAAEQTFSVSGEITEEMYDSRGSGIGATLKEIVNYFQSRSITMTLDGKIAVEYDFYDGAEFIFNRKTKMIEVNLPAPKLRIIEKDHRVVDRNEEYVNLKRFDNTERKLIEKLSQKALNESADERRLINLSMEQTAKIMQSIYAPVLEQFGEQVEGIEVTIRQEQENTSIQGKYGYDRANNNRQFRN